MCLGSVQWSFVGVEASTPIWLVAAMVVIRRHVIIMYFCGGRAECRSTMNCNVAGSCFQLQRTIHWLREEFWPENLVLIPV